MKHNVFSHAFSLVPRDIREDLKPTFSIFAVAITLFGRLEGIILMSKILHYCITYWKNIIATFWDIILFFVPFTIPLHFKMALTFSILFYLAALRGQHLVFRLDKTQEINIYSWYTRLKLPLMPFMILGFFFILFLKEPFHWTVIISSALVLLALKKAFGLLLKWPAFAFPYLVVGMAIMIFRVYVFVASMLLINMILVYAGI